MDCYGGTIAGAKIGLILAPTTGGTSILLGRVVGAGIGAVLLGVGSGFAGSYGGTTIARKYTGVWLKGLFMNEVLSVIKEMVFNNSIFLNVIVFIIIFNIFLMIFTYIYNKIYIKNYKDDFFDLFFGKENSLVFREVGGGLVVVAYWFLMRYSFELFLSRKTKFPSYEDILNKPFYMTPNAYKENIRLPS